MTTAQVVETSVTVNNNSPIQDHVHPDYQTQPTFKNTDVNLHSITGVPSVFSLEKKLSLLLKHWTVVTSRVGHVLSIQFQDIHVVWSEANFYSWHLATKVILNCIIEPINSWIKITHKITFISLAVQ